jgi:hypothetical protein
VSAVHIEWARSIILIIENLIQKDLY